MGGKQHHYSIHMTDEVFALALQCMKRGGDKSLNVLFERLVRRDRKAVTPCDDCRLAQALVPGVQVLEAAVKTLKPILLRTKRGNGRRKR
jgi:hypothetical protein